MKGFKHGMVGTKIYDIWKSILQRCDNPNHKSYHNYGGRGIKYDRAWKKCENFMKDMLPTYKEGLSIDRINNDWGYSKENCKWETYKNQMRNTRRNRLYKGKCITDWCIELGLNESTIRTRLSLGWTIKDALFTKIKKYER